jgi:carboxylesterase type B
MNYREGLFGFMPSPDLEKEGSLNAGVWDVAESFKWIRKYVQHFGGDPKRVTAFGISSGGMILSDLLVADDGKLDLFDVVIN